MRSGSTRRRATRRRRRSCAKRRRRCWPRSKPTGPSAGRLGFGAGALAAALALGRRDRAAAEAARARRALAVFEAARMGGERRPPAAAPREARSRRDLGPARTAGRRRRRDTAGPARLCRRRRAGLRAARASRTSRTCCSPRPAPGSARRSAISPRPRSGPSRPDGAVWISTYTKALQRQLDREGHRLFPDPAERKAKIVIRKGRENYLCLLNLEDALQGGFAGRAAILAQLVARWAAYSKDGDMVGGDLPGWLTSLFRRAGRDRADRPARRMRLRRLPALPALLHRARRPRAERRTPISSSPITRSSWSMPPRPRGGPGADPDRVRRGPSSVRRRRFDLRRRASPARRRSSCAAGSSAPKGARAAAAGASPRG